MNPNNLNDVQNVSGDHKRNLFALAVALVCVLVIAAVGGLFYFQTKSPSPDNLTENDVENGVIDFSTPGYYFAEYDGKDAVLYFDNGRYASGYVKTENLGSPTVDKAKIKNPILIFENKENKYNAPGADFLVDKERGKIYLVFYYGADPFVYGKDTMVEIYSIDLKTAQKTILHRHTIGDNTYPEKGSIDLMRLEKDWLVLGTQGCFACDGGPNWTVALMNGNTGQFKYLGLVGNIKVDGDKVSYQKLVPRTIPCPYNPSPSEVGPCASGVTTQQIYEPEGPVLYEDLGSTVPRIVDEPIQDWKRYIYNDQNYGFEFVYPLNWTVKQNFPPTLAIEKNPMSVSDAIIVTQTNKQTWEEAWTAVQKDIVDKSQINPDLPAAYPKYSQPEVVTINGGYKAIKQKYLSYEIIPNGVQYLFPEKGLIVLLADENFWPTDPSSEIGEGLYSIWSTFRINK